VKTIKLSSASRPLTSYAAEFRNEVLVLTERNRPVAAVVPLKGIDRESLALSSHPEFLALIARSRAQLRRGETLTLEEMKKAFSSDRLSTHALQPTRHGRGSRRKVQRHPRSARG
jgi:antitoxin (DNA-binding transcriptional repressor) of toxin-antitoxin stability system